MLELALLGIVQGLTEFLPVSSTAHLLFVEHYLGIPRPGLMLEAVLHLGTALAAVVLFWPDVARILRSVPVVLRRPGALIASDAHPEVRLTGAVMAATVVTAALALAFAGPLERMFDSVRATAYQLLVTGVILLWHRERGTRSAGEASLRDGALIGMAQAAAIVPGISRSGATIVVGLALGLGRTEAARLSFLMAIPAIIGAGVFSLKDAGTAVRLGYTAWELLAGAAVAGLFGALAIVWLLDLIRRRRLVAFSAYCWLAGLLVLATVR